MFLWFRVTPWPPWTSRAETSPVFQPALPAWLVGRLAAADEIGVGIWLVSRPSIG